MRTITVEIEDELYERARTRLEALGLSVEDYVEKALEILTYESHLND
jgi:antitoxin component of RelBE/YafQ-DinJ toxin-antitoxin module